MVRAGGWRGRRGSYERFEWERRAPAAGGWGRAVPLLVLVSAVVLVGAYVGVATYRTRTRAVLWQAATAGFSAADRAALISDVRALLPQPSLGGLGVQGLLSAGPEVVITDARRQRDWAVFHVEQLSGPERTPEPLGPGLYLAHRVGSAWRLLVPGSSAFCAQLGQVPDVLLDPLDKSGYC